MARNEDGWVGPEFPIPGSMALGGILFATGAHRDRDAARDRVVRVGISLLTTPKDRRR
jgi:hypothetical protein